MTIDVRPPSGVFHPGYISGRYYGVAAAAASNTVSAANTIYLSPVIIYRPVTIANVVFNETAAATVSQTCRGAIYADVGGVPTGAPLKEGAAALDLVANGIASADIALASSLSVNPGLIWIAFWFETSGGTFASFARHASPGGNSPIIGATSAPGAVGGATGGNSGYTMSSAFGASFPTLASLSTSSTTPHVGFKVA